MARILILGPTALADEFSSVIRSEHDAVVLSNALADIDGPFDAVFDLSIDSGNAGRASLIERRDALSKGEIVFVSGLTTTATAASQALGMQNVLATSLLPAVMTTAQNIELSASLQCDPAVRDRAVSLISDLTGRLVELVEDRLGLVSARVLAMVINEAAFAVMERVATAADIDTAMRLGTNYPFGPLAWADAIGHQSIVNILDALYDEYHEERYRACTLLRQHARAGRPFVAAATR